MTMRRLDRKRLFETEKLGKDVLGDIAVGPAMLNAVVSATQHRMGNMLQTDILLDLGTSKAAILAGGNTATQPIGEASGVAKICTVATSVFGIVTEIRSVCLEAPTTDGTAYANGIDVNIGDNGDGIRGTDDTANPAVVSGLTNIGELVGKETTKAYDNTANINGKSLYIGSGTSLGANVKATAALTGLDGHANIATGTKLELYKADGTKVEILFDRNVAHGSSTNLCVGLGGGPNVNNVESEVEDALQAAGFTTDTPNGDGTLTISQSAAGPAGNSATLGTDKQNAAVKATGDTSSISLAQFTGGTSQGLTSANTNATFTAGKFLIRINGFSEPDDLT